MEIVLSKVCKRNLYRSKQHLPYTTTLTSQYSVVERDTRKGQSDIMKWKEVKTNSFRDDFFTRQKKTGNASINVTMGRVRATIVAVKKL
jgi:hypothetical protein